jgi:hypothetical protein
MKRIAVLACLILALVRAGDVVADDSAALAFEGAYLLTQDDNFQRILSLDRSGTISQVSDQEPLLGFTAGLGAWQQTGPESVRARVIDFAYEVDGGKPIGPAMIIYDLAFSDLVAGKYQTVSGIYAGEQFAAGQDPLNPSEPPIRSFGIAFKGQRITAE